MKTVLYIRNSQPPSDRTVVQVSKLGVHERIAPKMINRPGGTPDYLFMHFHDPVMIKVGGGDQRVSDGTFIVWAPGAPHYYGCPDAPWDHSWVHVSGASVGELFEGTSIPLNTPFPFAELHLTEKYLLLLHNEIAGHGNPDSAILRNFVHSWIVEIQRCLSGDADQALPVRIREVKLFLETHFNETIRLKDLAAMSCLSMPHFCAQFRKYAGSPAIDYVVHLRMQHAAFRLADINMNVGEVAQSVGYEDLYYFSRLFRQHFGKSPSAYRAGLLRQGRLGQ